MLALLMLAFSCDREQPHRPANMTVNAQVLFIVYASVISLDSFQDPPERILKPGRKPLQ